MSRHLTLMLHWLPNDLQIVGTWSSVLYCCLNLVQPSEVHPLELAVSQWRWRLIRCLFDVYTTIDVYWPSLHRSSSCSLVCVVSFTDVRTHLYVVFVSFLFVFLIGGKNSNLWIKWKRISWSQSGVREGKEKPIKIQ